MDRKLAYLLLTLLTLSAVSACQTGGGTPANSHSPMAHHSPPLSPPSSAPVSAVPAYADTEPARGSLPATLDPEQFTGEVRTAYAAAREAPELLAQLPCYCYCDRGMGHKSLHSCFEDRHASVCDICMNEAHLALKLKKQGLSAADIRKQIIDNFGRTK